MNKREQFRSNKSIRDYFSKLDLDLSDPSDVEEFERRLWAYLEFFPFIAADFRLKGDCHAIHKTATIRNGQIENTTDVEQTLKDRAREYVKILKELREEMENIDLEVAHDHGTNS